MLRLIFAVLFCCAMLSIVPTDSDAGLFRRRAKCNYGSCYKPSYKMPCHKSCCKPKKKKCCTPQCAPKKKHHHKGEPNV